MPDSPLQLSYTSGYPKLQNNQNYIMFKESDFISANNKHIRG